VTAQARKSGQEAGCWPEQRVAVLIDLQNMYHSAKRIHGARVNFANVLKVAVAGRKLIRALAYGITTEGGEEEQFFEALRKRGFELKTKPLQTYYDGQKKGDWDIGIAMDLVRLAPKIDVAVLVSGDGDYQPLVEYAKAAGTRVEVMAFRESASAQLIQAADAFIDLSSNPRLFLLPST
jgi:uncharacterized LabA/DUF88 family protein